MIKPASAAVRWVPEKGWSNPDLLEAVREISLKHAIWFVYVEDNFDFSIYWKTRSKPWGNSANSPAKLVVLWGATPFDPIALLSWRSALIEEVGLSSKLLLVPAGEKPLGKWLNKQLGSWTEACPQQEEDGLQVGSLVKSRKDNQRDFDPAFLTVSPNGVLAHVLDQLDECKRLFRAAIGSNVGVKRKEVLTEVDKMLAANHDAKQLDLLSKNIQAKVDNKFGVDCNRLPRVLLLGPSGAGKTMIARYLAWRTSPNPNESLSRPFKRIPVPEYLNKEDAFEYDVFGYCNGAFTSAREKGNRGFLLERMGGVIFFDEIGEANPTIQAKLLAYLDDYRVSPRGWAGDPVFCPTLVIAATNRPIDEWADAVESGERNSFRNDLFRRFNTIIRVPPLNDRKEEMPFLVDAMLQMEAFNPGGKIKQVGGNALKQLQAHDYSKGNFRELENKLRAMCTNAIKEGRDYIVVRDL